MPIFSIPAFAPRNSLSKQSYLIDETAFKTEFASNESIILPLCHDSEWNNSDLNDFVENRTISPRNHVSTQVKHTFLKKPLCFFTEQAIAESGHDWLLPMKHDFIVQDYLKQLGIDSRLNVNPPDKKDTPYLNIVLYSFFGMVDVTLLAKQNTIISDTIKVLMDKGKLAHDRRLATSFNQPIKFFETVTIEEDSGDISVKQLPVTIEIADIEGNYHPYILRIHIIDACAIHGNAGYKTVCENLGLDTTAKSLMDDYKSDMMTGLKLHPKEFIEYSINDLNVYEILATYADLMKGIYKELGIEKYYKEPKLTIGSTVAELFSATLFDWMNIETEKFHCKKERKNILMTEMGLASAQHLRGSIRGSDMYLAGKVHGGRCHNNNPLNRYIVGPIADNDIAGAYSSIMEQLNIYKGKPWTWDSGNKKEKITLREFLKRHEHDFDPWHFCFCASTMENLINEQDFFVSWVNPKSARMKNVNPNGESDYIEVADYKSGQCRIYKNQIVNTPITTDSINFIRSLSKHARDELLDKLYVHSAIGYKRSEKGKTWDSINLGILIVSKLKEKRAHFKKEHGLHGNPSDYAMQQLLKLIINTIYGVMCSPHFVSSNVVVANCITQAIRLGVYLMEKGLNLQGAITDGCMGLLTLVLYMLGNNTIKLNNTVSLYKESSDSLGKKHMRLGPLDNAKNITLDWTLTTFKNKPIYLPVMTVTYSDRTEIIADKIVNNEYIEKNVNNWINKKAHEHLIKLFPQFEYLLKFLLIEVKDVYQSYTYHGAANYELVNPNGDKYAMRAYSKKSDVSIAVTIDKTGEMKQLPDYDGASIPQIALSRLRNPIVEKLPVSIKTRILKTKTYRELAFIERSDLQPGDSTIAVEMPNYCSLSQYTFRTVDQRTAWEKTATSLKTTCGETFEIYFTDKNGMLNYDLMVKTLSGLVDSGTHTPIRELNKLYKKVPSLDRTMVKLKIAEIRNESTFTSEIEEYDYCEIPD